MAKKQLDNQPAAIEVEQAVIGAMLMTRLAGTKAATILQGTDFYRPVHQALYNALLKFYDTERCKSAEESDVLLRLFVEQSDIDLTPLGGFDYLNACVEKAITPANIERHARIVKEKSLLRRQIALGHELIAKALEPEARPDDLHAWVDEKARALVREDTTALQPISTMLSPRFDEICANMQHQGLLGWPTGMSHLDRITHGFGGPRFVVLKGNRGSGKTHHVVHWCVECALAGRTAVFYSLDTPRSLILDRFAAHVSGLETHRIRRPQTDDDLSTIGMAYEWLYQAPIYLDCRTELTISQMLYRCRAVQDSGQELGLVAIDYAECVKCPRSDNREQELSQMADQVCQMRDELQTTVVVLSQVNDQGQERWSKALGNKCDLLLHWKEVDIERWEMHAEKARENVGGAWTCSMTLGLSRPWEDAPDYSDPGVPVIPPWWDRYDLLGLSANPQPSLEMAI